MTHVTCRLTAKHQDQPRNPTLGNRVRATFIFFTHIVCRAGSMYRSGIRLSVPSFAHCTLLLQVCCCGPSGQEILIDCCTAGAQQQTRAVSRLQLTWEAEQTCSQRNLSVSSGQLDTFSLSDNSLLSILAFRAKPSLL